MKIRKKNRNNFCYNCNKNITSFHIIWGKKILFYCSYCYNNNKKNSLTCYVCLHKLPRKMYSYYQCIKNCHKVCEQCVLSCGRKCINGYNFEVAIK